MTVGKPMKFKTLAMSAAIVGAMAMGGTITATSANALEINFGSSVRLKNAHVANGGTSQLDFRSASGFTGTPNSTTLGTGIGTLQFPTDSIFGPLGATINLKDIALKKLSGGTNASTDAEWELSGGPIDSFISGLTGGSGQYKLNSFKLFRTVEKGTATFKAFYTGIFDNIAFDGVGQFTAQNGLGTPNGTFGSNTVAVPTPALLPGLIGFGVAALRKRKGEAETEAEAIKAKA
jgi:hypothetical protein